MILHLIGGTETARVILADRLMDNRKNWRHLALEDMYGDDDFPEELSDMDAFNIVVACSCAVEELQQGMHIVVTHPLPEMLDLVKEQLADYDHVCVFLKNRETEANGSFDHVIDSAVASTRQILNQLNSIIGMAA